jgi:pilus assembly protein TadC
MSEPGEGVLGIGNASVYEIAIDAVLLTGVVVKLWLLRESHLDTKALTRAEMFNGKRNEIKVEQVNAWGKLFVISILLLLTGWYTVAVPEPRVPEVARALVISEAIFAAIVVALVGPGAYALIQRRRQMKSYREKQSAGWDGQDRRKET